MLKDLGPVGSGALGDGLRQGVGVDVAVCRREESGQDLDQYQQL